MCLLFGANIEYKNFEEKYHMDYYIAFFGTFMAFLRNSLKSSENMKKLLLRANSANINFFFEIVIPDADRR